MPIIPNYRPRKITRTLEMNNLKKYNDFLFDSILENIESGELTLVLSQRLRDILKNINHPISTKLLDTDLDEDKHYKITLVDMSVDDDKVTVASSNKLIDLLSDHINLDQDSFTYFSSNPHETFIWEKFRNTIKIGKLIRKLFPDIFLDNGLPGKDIESFVNLYKTIFNENDVSKLFGVVKGKDIIHWYRLENYGNDKYNSILGNSCMSVDCDDFINFYTINQKKVSMLILYEDDNKEKIVGRSLLWNVDEINGKEDKRIFMDRIYTIHEYQINYFIKYAKKHNYLYKETQAADEKYIVDSKISNKKDNEIVPDILSLYVHNINLSRYYPYLDTLKYLDQDRKILTNNDNDDDGNHLLYLLDTDGAPLDASYSEKYKRWINENDTNFVECYLLTNDLNSIEKYRKKEDAIYLPYYNEYIPRERYNDENIIKIDIGGDFDILKKDAIFLDYYGGWTSKKYVQMSYNKSKHYGVYLLTMDSIVSKILNDYLIKDDAIKVYTDITKTDFDYLPDNSDELKKWHIW